MDSVTHPWTLLHGGCPIRISPDQCSCAAPRSFSQLTTSFIASLSQGIHHSLFSFFFYFARRLIYIAIHKGHELYFFCSNFVVIVCAQPASRTDVLKESACAHLAARYTQTTCQLCCFCINTSKITSGLASPRSQVFLRTQSLGVENNGFEPLTPCLQSRCSSQLS